MEHITKMEERREYLYRGESSTIKKYGKENNGGEVYCPCSVERMMPRAFST
jgi:hypothetical protein